MKQIYTWSGALKVLLFWVIGISLFLILGAILYIFVLVFVDVLAPILEGVFANV